MSTAANQISRVIGRKVRYLALPRWVFYTLLRLVGRSPWMARGLVVMFGDMVAGHHDIDPTCEIERLTGKPPHDFLSFVRDHREAFGEAA